jgi:hypothetical protein
MPEPLLVRDVMRIGVVICEFQDAVPYSDMFLLPRGGLGAPTIAALVWVLIS